MSSESDQEERSSFYIPLENSMDPSTSQMKEIMFTLNKESGSGTPVVRRQAFQDNMMAHGSRDITDVEVHISQTSIMDSDDSNSDSDASPIEEEVFRASDLQTNKGKTDCL